MQKCYKQFKTGENGANLIKIPADYMNITCETFEVVVSLFGAQISSTKYVLDTTWYQELLKLCR